MCPFSGNKFLPFIWLGGNYKTDRPKKSLQVSFHRKIHDFFLIWQRIENTANFQSLPRQIVSQFSIKYKLSESDQCALTKQRSHYHLKIGILASIFRIKTIDIDLSISPFQFTMLMRDVTVTVICVDSYMANGILKPMLTAFVQCVNASTLSSQI